jgi:hypothetical protein
MPKPATPADPKVEPTPALGKRSHLVPRWVQVPLISACVAHCGNCQVSRGTPDYSKRKGPTHSLRRAPSLASLPVAASLPKQAMRHNLLL